MVPIVSTLIRNFRIGCRWVLKYKFKYSIGALITFPEHIRPFLCLIKSELRPIFDLLTEQIRFVDAVKSGIADIQNGRVLSDEDLDKV